MDIRTARTKTGLSKVAYIHKLDPAMKRRGSAITKHILDKVENGEQINPHRMDALQESLKEVFPEFADSEITTKPTGVNLRNHARHIAFLVFVLLSAGLVGVYYYFDLKDVINETLTIVGSLAGVLAFVFAIYKVVS